MSLKSALGFNNKKENEQNSVDYSLVVIIFMLLAFGLIMVFSASSANAHYVHGDAMYFFKKQLIWAVVGILVMWLVSRFSYLNLKRYANLIFVITCLLLIVVLFFGKSVNGARRWLGIGSLTFQPSEFAKLAVIMFLAKAFSEKPETVGKLLGGFILYLGITAAVAFIVLKEPHMSGAAIIGISGCIVMIVAGFKLRYFIFSGLIAGPIGFLLIITSEYRAKRLMAFKNPFVDKLGDSWQIVQSLYAIASGGLFGLGLGQSRQKFLYIPEPQNDFIFAVICEELGLIGAIFVMFLFALLIWKGIDIARKAPDDFSCLTATGITALIAVQVAMNIAVVTSTMPVTGVTLPFFSYGGTSLVILLMGMGILLNISRYTKK